jgi:hypothetical protein
VREGAPHQAVVNNARKEHHGLVAVTKANYFRKDIHAEALFGFVPPAPQWRSATKAPATAATYATNHAITATHGAVGHSLISRRRSAPLTAHGLQQFARDLGHRNIQNTTRYTALAAGCFRGFWRD